MTLKFHKKCLTKCWTRSILEKRVVAALSARRRHANKKACEQGGGTRRLGIGFLGGGAEWNCTTVPIKAL